MESEYLAYLKDAGFIFNFERYQRYHTWNNLIGISKDKSGFYWEDIKYDLMPFVEVLMEKYNVRAIRVYTPNKNDGKTQHTFTYSSNKGHSYNLTDFLNEKGIPDTILIAIEIIF